VLNANTISYLLPLVDWIRSRQTSYFKPQKPLALDDRDTTHPSVLHGTTSPDFDNAIHSLSKLRTMRCNSFIEAKPFHTHNDPRSLKVQLQTKRIL
jgi:hypothetical protein